MLYDQKKFNEMLRELIEKSDYTIYALSKQSGVNRTTIQKSLSGDRILSKEQLGAILPFLHLTPHEKNDLFKLHQIEQMGFTTYLRCEHIKNLAENINEEKNSEYSFHYNEKMHPNKLKLPYSCQKQYPILNLIYHLIGDISHTEKAPYVYLFCPFDDLFVSDILSLFQKDDYANLKITHVIPFVKGGKTNEVSAITNVKMLSFILPFIFNNCTDYIAYYYYEESLLSKMQIPFPYYLITNKHVLLISGDYQTALLLDAKMHDYYLKTFLNLCKESKNLIQHTSSSLALTNQCPGAHPQESYYSLNRQPCILLCIDSDIPERLIHDSCFQKQTIISNLVEQHYYLKRFKETLTAFSLDGLDKFCKDGEISGYPRELYRPFTPQERRTILEQILQFNSSKTNQFFIINDKHFHPSEKFSFYSNGIDAFFTYLEGNNCKICTIHETSITFAIKDFMEHAVEQHFFYSIQESNTMIYNAILRIPTD